MGFKADREIVKLHFVVAEVNASVVKAVVVGGVDEDADFEGTASGLKMEGQDDFILLDFVNEGVEFSQFGVEVFAKDTDVKEVYDGEQCYDAGKNLPPRRFMADTKPSE